MPKNDERLIAAGIYVISFFTAFLGPLIIWLIKKDDSSYIDYHGREYMNFFISYTIYGIVSGILVILLIGIFMLWIIGILAMVFTIVGAIKAYEGQEYRIPFIFRIL
ncbi:MULTISPECIES: DUF4870 domain-containing protein [unclassified Bacillus (in: firmicutes)]|uniref:DUF4870 domain-containing protein n=1 Tax=unclassified Bacillus (in: firmicutes) TaxID=185979 RepID=UPI001BE9DE86|nr:MULTISPECIES: DUF4870 domain-containing protein [unclassified Bacillus (in: firmicutes)]MBT2639485.1 DUF4870 domain-containing protein [Bacillus sp. ISL-39]MBT2662491.1 DUF4870 domain-containing protein [Bacillus sp. ISL-45]